MQVGPCFRKSLLVTRVDYVDHCINLVEIVFPETSRLPTHIPQREGVISILYRLYVEADGGHGLFKLLIAHLEQQRALARVVYS